MMGLFQLEIDNVNCELSFDRLGSSKNLFSYRSAVTILRLHMVNICNSSMKIRNMKSNVRIHFGTE